VIPYMFHSSNHNSRRRTGFTIIEVLAVVMILALVSGVVGVRVNAVSASARTQAAVSTILEVDARARILARQGQSAILSLHADGTQLELRRVFETEAIASRPLPSPLRVTVHILNRPSEVTQSIWYDRNGCTDDYSITITDPSTSDQHTLALYGISGQFVALEPAQ
jgi:prepilin-type N-terminal cleavage/methylation domain-containing protein